MLSQSPPLQNYPRHPPSCLEYRHYFNETISLFLRYKFGSSREHDFLPISNVQHWSLYLDILVSVHKLVTVVWEADGLSVSHRLSVTPGQMTRCTRLLLELTAGHLGFPRANWRGPAFCQQ